MRISWTIAVAVTVLVACQDSTPTPTTGPTAMPTPESTPESTNEASMDMVFIAAGEFTMGATQQQQRDALAFDWPSEWLVRVSALVDSAEPPHQVILDDYYIDRYEVTNLRYSAFVMDTGIPPATFSDLPPFNGPNQPVVGVSWHDALSYCQWAGKRLPTEAEWEKAARGTARLGYPWGDIWDSTRLRSADELAQKPIEAYSDWTRWQSGTQLNVASAPVGSYPGGASPYGVMDLAGNVWEWVADWYDPTYYANSPALNPRGPVTGQAKVLRGGGWDVPRVVVFTWFREIFTAPESITSTVVGFRCASNEQPSSQDGRAEFLSKSGVRNKPLSWCSLHLFPGLTDDLRAIPGNGST